jgi:hypothetical protein
MKRIWSFLIQYLCRKTVNTENLTLFANRINLIEKALGLNFQPEFIHPRKWGALCVFVDLQTDSAVYFRIVEHATDTSMGKGKLAGNFICFGLKLQVADQA